MYTALSLYWAKRIVVATSPAPLHAWFLLCYYKHPFNLTQEKHMKHYTALKYLKYLRFR